MFDFFCSIALILVGSICYFDIYFVFWDKPHIIRWEIDISGWNTTRCTTPSSPALSAPGRGGINAMVRENQRTRVGLISLYSYYIDNYIVVIGCYRDLENTETSWIFHSDFADKRWSLATVFQELWPLAPCVFTPCPKPARGAQTNELPSEAKLGCRNGVSRCEVDGCLADLETNQDFDAADPGRASSSSEGGSPDLLHAKVGDRRLDEMRWTMTEIRYGYWVQT